MPDHANQGHRDGGKSPSPPHTPRATAGSLAGGTPGKRTLVEGISTALANDSGGAPQPTANSTPVARPAPGAALNSDVARAGSGTIAAASDLRNNESRGDEGR